MERKKGILKNHQSDDARGAGEKVPALNRSYINIGGGVTRAINQTIAIRENVDNAGAGHKRRLESNVTLRRSPRLQNTVSKENAVVKDVPEKVHVKKGERKLDFDDDFVKPVPECLPEGVKKEEKRRPRQTRPVTVRIRNRRFIDKDNIFNRKDAESYLADNYPALEYRFAPKWLVEAMETLSPGQRKWVVKTGLVDLFNYKVKDYPTRLTFMIVQRVEAEKDRIKLDTGYIKYTAEDVNAVLGLLISEVPVTMGPHYELSNEWDKQFVPKKPNEITSKILCEKIKSSPAIDKWFKWNFLVLVGDYGALTKLEDL